MPKSSPNQTQLRIKSDLKTTSVSMPVCMPQHLSMNTCLKYLESFSWPHVGTPRGVTLWNAICATTMKRRSILEYTTHKSTFCMVCMHRTLISIRIYIYMVSCGLHTIIQRYQSDIHSSSVDPGLWDALAHGVHKKTLQVHGRRGLAWAVAGSYITHWLILSLNNGWCFGDIPRKLYCILIYILYIHINRINQQ